MLLDDAEYMKFLHANVALYYFTAITCKIIDDDNTFQDFIEVKNMDTVEKCRETLYKQPEIVDEFIGRNKHLLSPEIISILADFKKCICTTFILYKSEDGYGVFIDPVESKVYKVLALTAPFEDVVPRFPVMVDAFIVPYKKQIVYDGSMKVVGVPGENGDTTLLDHCHYLYYETEMITTL